MALSPAISPEQQAANRETQRIEAEAARKAGFDAVLGLVNAFDPSLKPSVLDEQIAERYRAGNPYMAKGWGDEGHERPAWNYGFNDALREHYGIATVTRDRVPQLNGRTTDGEQISSFEQAIEEARGLSAELGVVFWPEDRGSFTSPRFAVIRGFQIGEPVSYGFNGDSYPCGRVTDMGGKGNKDVGYRIITTTDHKGRERKFWRRRDTGTWKSEQTWSLMHGWWSDQNPSF